MKKIIILLIIVACLAFSTNTITCFALTKSEITEQSITASNDQSFSVNSHSDDSKNNENNSSLDSQSEIEAAVEVEKEIENAAENVLNGLDISGLDNEFSSLDFFKGKGSAKDRILEYISGDYDVNSASTLSSFINLLFDFIIQLLPVFSIILALCLFSAIINAIKPATLSKSVVELSFFVIFTMIVGLVSLNFTDVFKTVKALVVGLEGQQQAVFPIILTLMSASGGNATAIAFKPQISFLLKGISFVVNTLLLPLVAFIYVFTSLDGMSERFSLKKTGDFCKSCFKWIIGISAVVFNFFITAQSITASTYDGFSIKALKYALGNSVPLVGGLIGSGFDAALASCVLIKNAVGGFAMLGILFLCIAPVLKIGAFTIFLRLSAAIIEPISDKRISNFLSKTADTFSYLVAIIVVAALTYLITILLMLSSLGNVI